LRKIVDSVGNRKKEVGKQRVVSLGCRIWLMMGTTANHPPTSYLLSTNYFLKAGTQTWVSPKHCC
jgi:hypothetical protein